jgi:hypothetical protein
MTLRLLKRQIYQEMGAKNKYGRVEKSLVAELYSVVAYERRTTKKGKVIFSKHHTILQDVAWSIIEAREYDKLPIGSLHNYDIVGAVLKVLDGGR